MFTAGTEKARSSVESLRGSTQSIIGQLSRLQKSYETAGRSTLDWIAADEKASEEVKEHARALLMQVDALEKLAAAKKNGSHFTTGMTRWQNEYQNDPWARGMRNLAYGDATREPELSAAEHRRLTGASRDKMEADEAVARDNADRLRKEKQRIRGDRDAETDAEKAAADAERDRRNDAVRDIHGKNMDRRRMKGEAFPGLEGVTGAENQRFLREREQLSRRMDKEGISSPADRDRLKDGLKNTQIEEVANRIEEERGAILDRLSARVKSAALAEDEYALSKLRGANASKEEIKAAQDRVNKHTLNELRDRGASKSELDLAETRMNQAHDIQGRGSQGKDNRKWAGVEGFRAIEDFAQGSAFGGLRGGLLAASNNISQMGAAFGAFGAMAGSAVSTVIVLGSQAFDAWRKSITGAEAAEAAVKNYDRAISNTIPHLQEMLDKNFQLRDVRNRKDEDSNVKGTASEIRQLKDDLEKQTKVVAAEAEAKKFRDSGRGMTGLSAQDLVVERERRKDDPLPFISSVIRAVTGTQRRGEHLSDEVIAPDSAEKQRDIETKNLQAAERITADGFRLEELKKQHQQLVHRDLEIELGKLDDANARRDRLRRGVGEPETEADGWRMQHELNQRERTKKMDDTSSGYKYLQSRATELAKANADRERVGGGAMLEAQLEFQRNMDKIKKASGLGLLDPTERASAESAELKNRDRTIREAKYGNLQADGRSGFGNANANSVQGTNAIVSAIRYAQQSKDNAEQKRSGDILADLLIVQQRAEALLKKDPLTPVSL